MIAPINKFILAVLHPKMLFIPVVDQLIVGLKAVGVEDGIDNQR
jgi:hypothetical protein